MRLEDTNAGPKHVHLAILKRAKGAAPAEAAPAPEDAPVEVEPAAAKDAPAADARPHRDARQADVKPARAERDPARADAKPAPAEADVARADPTPAAVARDAPAAATIASAHRAMPPAPIVTGAAGWRKRKRRELARRAGSYAAVALVAGFAVGWLIPGTRPARTAATATTAQAPVAAEPVAAAHDDDAVAAADVDAPARPDTSASTNGAIAVPDSATMVAPPEIATAASEPAPAGGDVGAAPAARPATGVEAGRGSVRSTRLAASDRTTIERLERDDLSDDAKMDLVETLARDRANHATDALLAATRSSSLVVSMAAVKALTGRPCPRVEAPLIGLLGHDDWQRRAWAARVLGDGHCKAARAPLQNRLHLESDPRVRAQIVAAVRALGGRRR